MFLYYLDNKSQNDVIKPLSFFNTKLEIAIIEWQWPPLIMAYVYSATITLKRTSGYNNNNVYLIKRPY